MRRRPTGALLLFLMLAVIASCSPRAEVRDSTPTSGTKDRQPVAAEIIFWGRYYMSKQCRESPKGVYALGLHRVCEVLEVLHGQLKLERLLGPGLPEDTQEGEIYTFRWKLSESTEKELRKAEAGGYTGMWLDDERLELTGAAVPTHR